MNDAINALLNLRYYWDGCPHDDVCDLPSDKCHGCESWRDTREMAMLEECYGLDGEEKSDPFFSRILSF